MTEKMKSFVKGILLGLCGHPLSQGKEPVAYLYNGVRLPKLPESEFLHKVITRASDGSIKLICGESPFVIRAYDNGNTSLFVDNSQNRGKGKAQMFDYVNGAWEFYHEYLACTIINGIGGFGGEPIWCNNVDIFKVSYTDSTYDTIEYGDVYLAASEPVPVYE